MTDTIESKVSVGDTNVALIETDGDDGAGFTKSKKSIKVIRTTIGVLSAYLKSNPTTDLNSFFQQKESKIWGLIENSFDWKSPTRKMSAGLLYHQQKNPTDPEWSSLTEEMKKPWIEKADAYVPQPKDANSSDGTRQRSPEALKKDAFFKAWTASNPCPTGVSTEDKKARVVARSKAWAEMQSKPDELSAFILAFESIVKIPKTKGRKKGVIAPFNLFQADFAKINPEGKQKDETDILYLERIKHIRETRTQAWDKIKKGENVEGYKSLKEYEGMIHPIQASEEKEDNDSSSSDDE